VQVQDPWATFSWLLWQTAVAAPAYIAVLTLPLAAFWFCGLRGAARAIMAAFVAHIGPLAQLAMGAWLYGAARAHGYLNIVHFALAVVGLVGVVVILRPLRQKVPIWFFVFFYFGIGVITFIAGAISGMALVNDWI
jgi:hypothetical protein